MTGSWMKTPQPFFHIPCGQWFKTKGQRHVCEMKGKKKKAKKGC